MIVPVLFYIFVVFTAIQITYNLIFSVLLLPKKTTTNSTEEVPVSVIICVKNEAKNLMLSLPSIIAQTHKNFEIVLINYASSDNTLDIMETFKINHPNIKIVNVENNESFWGNKKYALSLGIKAATNNNLLFTTPSCRALSKNWVTTMSSHFSEEKTIILGYSKYKKEKTVLNLLVRFDNFITALQYFSWAQLGSPIMATGKNLAYNRAEFFNVKGFIKHIHIKEGEDDLFIQDAANQENTTNCILEDSFTESIAPSTFKDWFTEKTLRFSTRKHYKLKDRLLINFFSISKAVFYILAIALLFIYSYKIILAILAFYYLLQYIIIGFSANKLKETQVIYFLPFLEIGVLLFQFSIFINNLWLKTNSWK